MDRSTLKKQSKKKKLQLLPFVEKKNHIEAQKYLISSWFLKYVWNYWYKHFETRQIHQMKFHSFRAGSVSAVEDGWVEILF